MLVLVRHGRTEANAARQLQGRVDLPLDELGLRQGAALGAAGVAATAALIVCSPLLRARQTAAAAAPGREPVIDHRWIEVDYGVLDREPVVGEWNDLWDRWLADPEYAPPGGEPLAAVGRRVREACEELAPRAAEEDVVVVTHTSPIKAAVAWALGVGDGTAAQMFLDVASVTRIHFGDRGPMLRSFNDVSHLAGVVD